VRRGSRAGRVLALLLLVALTLGAWAVVLMRDEPGASTATAADPTDSTQRTPSSDPEVVAPTVPDQRRAVFTDGDDLPDGARIFDNGANASGMALTAQGLTHGPATGADAAGLVETELKSDVRALGFRVLFADTSDGGQAGSVALIASEASIVDALTQGEPVPGTGFRLIAGPGSWELSVDTVDDEERVIASGTYEAAGGPATFQIVRKGATAYVVDPTGRTVTVSDPAVEGLAGPWAAWGLTESGPEQKPSVIEAVWAG
jgi:hypothetical protein